MSHGEKERLTMQDQYAVASRPVLARAQWHPIAAVVVGLGLLAATGAPARALR